MKTPFAIVRKGYDKNAVDEYINRLNAQYVGTQNTLKKKIELLEEDKAALSKETAAYKKKEQALADALLQAQDMVSQAKEHAKLLADAEKNRLETFCARWTTYAGQAMDDENPALCETLRSMQTEYAAKVAKALGQNLFCTIDALYPEYLAEQERIKGASQNAVHIEELLHKLRS